MGIHNSLAVGIAAAFASVAIGAGWQVATRLGTTTSLQPVDLALLRYCIPAILLAPIWWRVRPIPANVDRRVLLAMLIGGGLPFGLLGMVGAQFAPVAHMGALLPGAMPLFVALLAAIVLGERFSVARLAGFMLILLGIAAIGARALLVRDDGAWRGDLLFLSAAFVWAIYTIAFRRSGMTPWQSSAIICLWSALFVMPLWLLSGPERVLAAPVADLVLQFIMQGIVAGVAGLWLYALAVAGIGPSRAAAIGALVPVLSAVGGAVLLGEFPDLPVMAGVVLTVCGVFLASGVLALRRAG
ncbi:MAG TPA: DMT family transporter [Ferrovibrio sp.]|jgi:drug/metabolite transporter (DMT)-like permease|uniref:DMT family transporter n=1 Tax=Ferrovibrio sp. TaxID=1917215 RepID=UPI002B4ABB1B|nr:DMT family transporter [Ferrovibrio sp.]HLT78098.1 DMT family transporter [Ferrovibrio sp.]